MRPELVAAVWDGRKRETRRIARGDRPCPYHVGEEIGVGEAHRLYRLANGGTFCRYLDGTHSAEVAGLRDGITVGHIDEELNTAREARVRSGRFMPDAFVRMRLRITAVRRECLWEITPAGVRWEGAPRREGPENGVAREAQEAAWFLDLWDAIHGDIPGAGWADNPEVFVIAFDSEPQA